MTMILGKIVSSICLFLTVCGIICLLLDGFFERPPSYSGVLSKKSKKWYDDEDEDDEPDPILNNY